MEVVTIKCSEFVECLGRFSNAFNDNTVGIVNFNNINADNPEIFESNKSSFIYQVIKNLNYSVVKIINANKRFLMKDYKQILNSISESYWERIKYENVNFFYSDIKSEIYETSINMFIKNVFKRMYSEITDLDSKYAKIGDRLDNIVNDIMIRYTSQVKVNEETKKETVVCGFSDVLDFSTGKSIIPIPIFFEADSQLSEGNATSFISKIIKFIFYIGLVDMIRDYFIYGKHKYYYGDIPALNKILIRNTTYMESFAVEYNRFTKRVEALINPIYIKRHLVRSQLMNDSIFTTILTETVSILMKENSKEEDMAMASHMDNMCKLIMNVKSMSSPNMDPRCDTVLDNVDDLDRLNIYRVMELFKTKKSVFEPLKETFKTLTKPRIIPLFHKYIVLKNEDDLKQLDNSTTVKEYLDIFKDAIFKYVEDFTKDVSKINEWVDEKIISKISYGYNYDAEDDFREYIRKHSIHETGFDSFTNPAVYKLLEK